MHKILLLLLCIAGWNAGPVAGAEAKPVSEDPALEQRVMQISNELRCLVCQNQTIADSHAELAIDLRNQVRDQLKQGKSEQEILDYMVQRYGDFVRYRPPVKLQTLVLWVGPFLLLAGGRRRSDGRRCGRRRGRRRLGATYGCRAGEHTGDRKSARSGR